MNVLSPSINSSYTTDIQKIWKFACYDGFRIIAFLQEKFKYKNTSFSELPLFYTVKQDMRRLDLSQRKTHLIEIYSLWYDIDLQDDLNNQIRDEVEIFVKNRERLIFKPSVLPNTVRCELDRTHGINDEQEYNTILLTVKRKHVELSNEPSVVYDTLWMYKEVNEWNHNGKHIEELTEWDKTLNKFDLILIKVDEIRKAYSKLGWDEDLPDQLNILEYVIGHRLFNSNSLGILSDLSIFYDAQTDSCYLICKRKDYQEKHEKNIRVLLDNIIKCSTSKPERITSPTLELSYHNFSDLSNKIEELASKHLIKIMYMSNLINNVCQLKIYFSYKTMKKNNKHKKDPKKFFKEFDFERLLKQSKEDCDIFNKNRRLIDWFELDSEIKESIPDQLEISTESHKRTLACASKLLEQELQKVQES